MCCMFFFFKHKTAYEMRISDWSSDVCSSDLGHRLCRRFRGRLHRGLGGRPGGGLGHRFGGRGLGGGFGCLGDRKSVVEGKSVSVRVDLGGRRIIKQKISKHATESYHYRSRRDTLMSRTSYTNYTPNQI